MCVCVRLYVYMAYAIWYMYMHMYVYVYQKSARCIPPSPLLSPGPKFFPGLVGLLQTFEDAHVDLHGVGGFKGRFA